MNNMNKFGLPAGLGNPNNFSRPTGFYQVPTDFVELPSRGKFYPEDSPLCGVEKLEVRFMTAREEDLLVSPSLQKEGLAIDRVIESILVDKNVRAKDLLIGDKTAVLINARKNAYGDEYSFPFICTNCGKQNETIKKLSEVSTKEIIEDEKCRISDKGTILITLPKTSAVVELKILTSDDENKIQKAVENRLKANLPAEALLTRYRQMIISINGETDIEYIINFVNNMPILDSTHMKKRYASMNPDVQFLYKTECSHCSVVNEGEVPILANFFWPDV